ncbi:MAG TPA: asparagine synthase C-terminal domain-containing protein, partial [Halioglobus sp.]
HHDSTHPRDERYFIEQVSRWLQLFPDYIDDGAYPLLTPYVQTTCPLELYQPQLSLDTDRYQPVRGRVLLTGEGGDELLKFSSVRSALGETNVINTVAMVYRLKALYGKTPTLGTGLGTLKKRFSHRNRDVHVPYPYPAWINPDFEKELDLQQRWTACWAENHSCSGVKLSRHPQIARSLMVPDWNTDDYYMNGGCTLMEQRSPFLDPRLVDLVMSLPALPWLFNKHLLRQCMENKLPREVLRRPKTPLGTLHASLLRKNVLEKFRPATATEGYIDANWIGALPKSAGSAVASYVNLRPLLLNCWLDALNP